MDKRSSGCNIISSLGFETTTKSTKKSTNINFYNSNQDTEYQKRADYEGHPLFILVIFFISFFIIWVSYFGVIPKVMRLVASHVKNMLRLMILLFDGLKYAQSGFPLSLFHLIMIIKKYAV